MTTRSEQRRINVQQGKPVNEGLEECKSCNDCIHYDVCEKKYRLSTYHGEMDSRPTYDRKCDYDFKDKSRFVELPCAVGDTVYRVIADKRVKHPHECKVIGYWYSEDESCSRIHLVRYVNGVFDYSMSVPFTDFGKTVFLAKEEAEQALLRKEDEKR